MDKKATIIGSRSDITVAEYERKLAEAEAELAKCRDQYKDLEQHYSEMKRQRDAAIKELSNLNAGTGGIRFYVRPTIPEAVEVIHNAQNESYIICENCGKPGYKIYQYWIKTLLEGGDGGGEGISRESSIRQGLEALIKKIEERKALEYVDILSELRAIVKGE